MNIWGTVAHLLSKLLLTSSHGKDTILPQQNYNVLGIVLRNKVKEYTERYKYPNWWSKLTPWKENYMQNFYGNYSPEFKWWLKYEKRKAIGAHSMELLLQMLNCGIAFVHQEKTAGANIKRTYYWKINS